MPGCEKCSFAASSRSLPVRVTSSVVPACAPAGKMLSSRAAGSWAKASCGTRLSSASCRTRVTIVVCIGCRLLRPSRQSSRHVPRGDAVFSCWMLFSCATRFRLRPSCDHEGERAHLSDEQKLLRVEHRPQQIFVGLLLVLVVFHVRQDKRQFLVARRAGVGPVVQLGHLLGVGQLFVLG